MGAVSIHIAIFYGFKGQWFTGVGMNPQSNPDIQMAMSHHPPQEFHAILDYLWPGCFIAKALSL